MGHDVMRNGCVLILVSFSCIALLGAEEDDPAS